MRTARRLEALQGYAFAELDRLRDERRAAGADVIDFGVGDPTDPVPEGVLAAAAAGLQRHRRAGYPSYVGRPDFRAAAAAWLQRRYGVELDPATQLSSTLGSKEAIFHLAGALTDAGDVVLTPSPGYPPYLQGARYVGAVPHPYAVLEAGPILPDLDALAADVAAHLRLVWITQPHVPTGRVAGLAALRRLVAQARERDVLVCSDEAYGDLWIEAPPASALQAGVEGVLAFHSLSKRSCMTGFRVGFVAGDARAVAALQALKTNIDSGTPDFVQDAAIAALADEAAPREARQRLAWRAEALLPALRGLGCEVDGPQAGLYLWARVPRSASGVDFARDLLAGPAALATLPGEWLAEEVPEAGCHPGAGRVRLALVPSLARCQEAAERLQRWARP